MKVMKSGSKDDITYLEELIYFIFQSRKPNIYPESMQKKMLHFRLQTLRKQNKKNPQKKPVSNKSLNTVCPHTSQLQLCF